jgi:hypothetical protein
VDDVINFLDDLNINYKNVGIVSNDDIFVNGFSFGKTSEYTNIYNTSLENKLV